MIFKRAAALAALCSSLCGCPSGGDGNSIQPGVKVHLAEVHLESQDGAVAHKVAVSSKAAIPGGYAHDQLEHHHGHDKNDVGLSLYSIYLVLDNLELVQCTSLTQLPLDLLNGVLGVAQAHGGHGNEPAGGRGLDKPNVIDLMSEDDFVLPLGDVSLAPGRYCGLQVAVARLASDAYGKPAFTAASNDDPTTVPEVPDLSGKAFSIKADYCAERDTANACVRRAKADVDDVSLTLPLAVTINFDQPLVLDANNREAHAALGIAYGNWVQDLDVTQLASSAAERQKLLNNIVNSLHIHTAGFGALPENHD